MMEAWAILIGVVILIVAFGLYVLFYRKQHFSTRQKKNIRKYWMEVELLGKHNPEQAILRADKLLDHALEIAGFKGTLGEKLKQARHVFSDNNQLWNAHKIRNKIAHEVHFQPNPTQVMAALKGFRQAFHDLGVDL